MMQLPGALVGRRPLRTAGGNAAPRERTEPLRTVLCVLPRRLPANPIKALLKGYELAAADTWTAALRLARHRPYDLYVVHSPLVWSEPAEICAKIRAFDSHTPLILYSVHPSAAERRDAIGSGSIQAYVARSDDAHNLAGTAGQLIMLAELRSMEAMKSAAQVMRDHIVRRLARFNDRRSGEGSTLPLRAQTRVKIEARRMFAAAGGSRANFERLWPSLLESALECLPAT